MAKTRNGYSLTELIIIVIFLGVLAAIAVPRFNFAIIAKQKADCQARKIVTDLRRTRTLAISNAATNPTGFSLRMTGSSPHYSGYRIVDDSNSATVDSQTIDSHISCSGISQVRFGPLGNVKGIGLLIVSAEGRRYRITALSGTGVVKCVQY